MILHKMHSIVFLSNLRFVYIRVMKIYLEEFALSGNVPRVSIFDGNDKGFFSCFNVDGRIKTHECGGILAAYLRYSKLKVTFVFRG